MQVGSEACAKFYVTCFPGVQSQGAEVYCPNTAAGGHLWGQGLDLRDRRG
ncbi:unnamed protein product [Gulo gulo]|uniref:Uncharacterized protein n=1 Tax=Gulo gulo TaxID=48420 RepID=A0A9X9M624_GULGU|nr:unnamed protein product [Gulo gulo]